ncbi:peptidoglycan DD-metalloendopeptidase family protein [Maribacter sp. 2308TA10-17]|uniref:peptidoglycan DD-metalloendopeptidase family protein n=1 Tax=Maribacter sp. 2308TA10-17 TaxID=3386276 RepID=UPI0039BC3644
MEAFFVHLIKSSCILFLFLLSYYVFLKKETYFASNRLFLVIGLIASLLLPFISFTKTVYVQAAPISFMELSETPLSTTNTAPTEPFDWTLFFLIVYVVVTIYLTVKLILQLLAIQKIKRSSQIIPEDYYYHVQTAKDISPFSFFKYIFYHPNQFSTKELKTIISHEKVHARGMHSVDILLTELVCILQWFNPVIWIYKIMVKQNLEFLADSRTCRYGEDKRNYQYLMLKHATGNHKINLVNPFFNSIIKKRIVMLNQNQSQRINLLKLLIVLPFLVVFLVSFNTKEVVKFSEESVLSNFEYSEVPTFKSPLKQGDIIRISSGFGPAESPFTNTIENHTGIDLVGQVGKEVRASYTGVVKVSSNDNTKGNHILIEHENGYSTKYLHLKDRLVVEGDKVDVGETIGHLGNTGKSTGPHLHFEILKSGKAINPESLIPFKTGNTHAETGTDTEKKIEIRIDKDTSNEELKKIKKDLSEKGFDFSYTVVHNDKNEIISLSIDVRSKSSKKQQMSGSSTFYNDEEPIDPVTLVMDDENTMFFMGDSNAEVMHEEDDHSVWVHQGDSKIRTVKITEENGKKTIRVNGKKVSEDEYDQLNEGDSDGHLIKIKSSKKGDHKNVMIIKKDADDDMEWIEEDGDSVFFLHDEGDIEPIFYIDGKQATKEEFKALSKDEIEKIEVSKGKSALEKYGEKAENGVVEVITKKN